MLIKPVEPDARGPWKDGRVAAHALALRSYILASGSGNTDGQGTGIQLIYTRKSLSILSHDERSFL